MSRLASTFARTRAEGRAALIAFVTGGDPTPADTGAILDALVEGGADVIELGMSCCATYAESTAPSGYYPARRRCRRPLRTSGGRSSCHKEAANRPHAAFSSANPVL